MICDVIDIKINNFVVLFFEFRYDFCYIVEFGCVNGCKVFGMGKDDVLWIFNLIMELKGVFCGFCGEVGGSIVYMKRYGIFLIVLWGKFSDFCVCV